MALTPESRFLILADGAFGPMTSKTANVIIRYRPDRVVAVVDRRNAGRTVDAILGFGGKTPVVSSMKEGLELGADTILIGIAPVGGRLPEEWRRWLLEAIEVGCDIWSGLHTFLADDPVLAERARHMGTAIHDVRRPPADLDVASGRARHLDPFIIQTVGTDCNVGKMTSQVELTRALNARGVRTRFVPTGQTGIFLEGWGIAVDAVVADFIAGAAERITVEGSKDADIVMVEGQGSINHPGYSGVTLGLLHGACPDALILCHQAGRRFIGEFRQDVAFPIPSLTEYVRWYEALAAPVMPTQVVGIALNTLDLNEDAARRACEAARAETGLPATDPVRFDSEPLIDAILDARARYLEARAAGRAVSAEGEGAK
jgi:uncharacterized NAD-dependent epimerase/dehydratase family protein